MINDSLDSFLQDLDDVRTGERSKRLVSTSLQGLDKNMCGGFESGQVIIIGARPGMGKSTLGVQFAKHAAQQGKKTIFFSLEMPDRELTGRLIASTGNIPYSTLRQAFSGLQKPDKDFYGLVEKSVEELRKIPLQVVDRAGIFVESIRDIAKDEGAKFIVVDYLQLVRTKARFDVREQQVAEVSRQLKEMAKELKCPVVALAQLNRQVEMRVNKRPNLADLRESGSIEQDADIVMFLYREGYYNKLKRDDGITEIIVSKQRAGQPFDIEATFEFNSMRFTEGGMW